MQPRVGIKTSAGGLSPIEVQVCIGQSASSRQGSVYWLAGLGRLVRVASGCGHPRWGSDNCWLESTMSSRATGCALDSLQQLGQGPSVLQEGPGRVVAGCCHSTGPAVGWQIMHNPTQTYAIVPNVPDLCRRWHPSRVPRTSCGMCRRRWSLTTSGGAVHSRF